MEVLRENDKAIQSRHEQNQSQFTEEGMRRLTKALFTPEGILGTSLVIIVILAAIIGPFVVPYKPTKTNVLNKLLPPSSTHFFGTDIVGRDLFSRVLDATHISLQSGITVVLFASAIGCTLGMLAGYLGGFVETIIMRITDMFVGFPALILAIAVVAALGAGLTHGVIAVTFIWWPSYARLTRGQTLSLKPELYIEAAKALGASNVRVIFRHIFPNLIGPITVKMTVDIGYAILYVAALGFLGLGAQPPTPEWGQMIAESRTYTLGYPWYPISPGLALFLTVMGFNLLGEALQDFVSVEVTSLQ